MKTKNNNEQRIKKGGDSNVEKTKKPFNKKKYREQKYSLKYKVKQYEDRRNTAIKRSFFKSKKKDEEAAPSNLDQESQEKPNKTNKKQNNPLSEQWKFKAEQKLKVKEEKMKAIREREQAMKKYQEKRRIINKKMTKKNKWGQPALHTRMEVLHERLMEKFKNNQL